MWVQRLRFLRLNQLVAARDFLRAKADAAVGVPMEETMPNAVEAPGEEAKAEAAAGGPMEETMPIAVEAPGEEAKAEATVGVPTVAGDTEVVLTLEQIAQISANREVALARRAAAQEARVIANRSSTLMGVTATEAEQALLHQECPRFDRFDFTK